MPRLSLYRPEKGNDYKFFDRQILEQFMIGGTDIYIHKYLGPDTPEDGQGTPSQPTQNNIVPELGIQDLLLLENRDRKYSTDVYVARCIYNMQQLDWSLTQFGLFLANDTIFIHVHLNDTVSRIGRKLMAGDVIELPHLKDPHALNDAQTALRRFYVIDDVLRPTEGFSQTWYPHLIKLKCKPLVAGQEFKQILDMPAEDANSPYAQAGSDTTLKDIMTAFNKNMEINDAIIAQAEADAPLSGYDTDHLWMVPVDANGKVMLNDASNTTVDASSIGFDPSISLLSSRQNYYLGYMLGDGIPPNGYRMAGNPGVAFPENVEEGAFFLRTDYSPNRLFRYDGRKWVKFEDKVRMTLTNTSSRKTQKLGFINNDTVTRIGDKSMSEKQTLSQAKDFAKKLKPDNP